MIDEIWICNHTHHDIGFNDYQDVCLRQHGEFIDEALDLIEATADRPEPEQFRWACEAHGPLLRWLDRSGSASAERLRHWNRHGAIEISAMQYNTTPLLSPEALRRTFLPVRRLREEFGLDVSVAMQADVNGASGLLPDLLPSIGVDTLTMAINPSRGGAPEPFPGGFWWEGPTGGELLVWNGFHYLFGRSQAKLGDWRYAEQSLNHYLRELEERNFPYAELYIESTHPMRVDNGPPDPAFPDFVREWNSSGRTPALRFVTPSMWARRLRETYGADLPRRRGDWTDWWADGVGSSAAETRINRATHERLQQMDTVAGWLRAQGLPSQSREHAAQAWDSAILYDEHTWGAFSSIEAPSADFTASQWNRKASFAHEASMLSHDLLTRDTRRLLETIGDPLPTGRFNLGDLSDAQAFGHDEDAALLVNTLPYPRTLEVLVPEYRGGGAPAGVLESEFPRDVPWGGQPSEGLQRVRADVPGYGYAFADLDTPLANEDLHCTPSTMSNELLEVTIAPDGGLEVRRRSDGTLLTSELDGAPFGAMVHERPAASTDRDVLYHQDFASWEFGAWREDVDFDRLPGEIVTADAPRLVAGRLEQHSTFHLGGCSRARRIISLASHFPTLSVAWELEKERCTTPEALYAVFGTPFEATGGYRADVNGMPCRFEEDQLPGSVRYFAPVRRWSAVDTTAGTVALCTPDAPLVQYGGISTNDFSPRRTGRAGLVSWAANNHWMVNFRASQEGPLRFRYHVAWFPDATDAAVNRWAEDLCTPPLVVRGYRPLGDRAGSFAADLIPDDPRLECAVVAADHGDGRLLMVRNISADQVPCTPPAGFEAVDALERPTEAMGEDEIAPYGWAWWREVTPR